MILRPRSFVRPSILLLMVMAIWAPVLADGDPGWPRQITVPEAKIVIYQPQPDEYEGNILTGRAAVSVTPKGKTEPVFGGVWLRARVEIDREKRIVEFADLTVPRVKFPGAKPEDEKKLGSIIEKEFPKWDLKVSLDRLVASLQLVQKEKAAAEAFNTAPPRIVIEKVPAILVNIDGEPVLRAVEGTELKRVINTAFFLVFDGKKYYLNGSSVWFTAEDLKAEWSTTKNPPKEVAEFYEKNLSKAAKDAQKSTTASTAKESGKPPKIVVSTEPTELIVLEGEPKMSTITGTDLLYVSNSKSDVFLVTAGQDYYVLLSGRWFKSKSLDGPWTFVKPDELPADFKKIPEPSKKGSVLSSVAGTVQAEEALIDAQIPQTAAVKKSEAKTKVEYDGKPEFKKIPNTEVEYAVNTASQVMRIKGKYYVCDQAVWFVGDSPNGPWTIAEKAPPEVQQIPPDSPVYNTKYVYVYESTPEVVYVGYMPGYVGCYPYYGTVVWGTGWYYPPYVSPYAYYPYHATWGFSFHYNPYTGWSMGIGVSFGPITFSFWGGGYGGYYGPGYGGGYYHGGNTINIGEINVGNGNIGNGNNPGRGDRPQPKGTNSNIYNKSENKTRNASTKDKSSRPQPKNVPSASNNLYADRDGNVHKRSNDGSWQTRDGSSWKSSPGASQKDRGGAGGAGGGYGGGAGASSMERDYQARQRGSARTQGFQGGGMRGGGGGGRRR